MLIIDDLLLLPVRGFLAVARAVQEYVEKQIADPSVVQQQLVEARLLYEMEEISEDEYRRREAELLARLRGIREREAGAGDER